MKNEESTRKRIGQGAELGPPPGRPDTLTGFIDMDTHHPDQLGLYYSDDDIRELVPNPSLAEPIVEASHSHEQGVDENA